MSPLSLVAALSLAASAAAVSLPSTPLTLRQDGTGAMAPRAVGDDVTITIKGVKTVGHTSTVTRFTLPPHMVASGAAMNTMLFSFQNLFNSSTEPILMSEVNLWCVATHQTISHTHPCTRSLFLLCEKQEIIA
jgi:hypothetical protein